MSAREGQITLEADGMVLGGIADFTYFPEQGKWEVIEKCDYYYRDLYTNQQMIEFARHILKICGEAA